MFGWFNSAPSRASSRKSFTNSAFSAKAGRTRLTATVRSKPPSGQ